jgi:uncharacterized protein (DUF1778 family)
MDCTMATTSMTKPPRAKFRLRMLEADRILIERAATSGGKTLSEFIVEAARAAASDLLTDRASIAVSMRAHQAFLARLDRSPQPSDRLRRTLGTKTPWAQPSVVTQPYPMPLPKSCPNEGDQ